MKIIDFNKNHIEEAEYIALANYNEERNIVKTLPFIDVLPSLECFADNGLGVAAFEDDKMIGFLCCYEPWDNAFNSAAKGTFSPIHANGAVFDNRDMIYKRLYETAAEKWIRKKIAYHAIGLYSHDTQAINALFTYGFGLRCIDAVRITDTFECKRFELITYEELAKINVKQIRELRAMLAAHLGSSPCFMYSSRQDFQDWLIRREKRDTRLFVAKQADKSIAFIEISHNGENFVSENSSIKNICGAFCLPELRGNGIIQGLLNYVISKLKDEGYIYLGVDFESFNPTAIGFWLKYFTAYTNSVVRRIDECALQS